MSIDFGLRRFREYCVGGDNITVVTDHKPLVPIFDDKRLGSIRIDRTKLRHQDIDYSVVWQQGKNNPADYLSRHPIKATRAHRSEASEVAKLLYVLHNDAYFMEELTPQRIVEETKKDELQSKEVSRQVQDQGMDVSTQAREECQALHLIHELRLCRAQQVVRG